MFKLNRLIFQEKDYQENLEKENMLAETDFIRSLKSEELESIQLKSRLDDIRNEKERLLNDLVEAEFIFILIILIIVTSFLLEDK